MFAEFIFGIVHILSDSVSSGHMYLNIRFNGIPETKTVTLLHEMFD